MKDEKSKGEIFVKKTITEWYEAKHEDACKEEIDYINSNPPKICPFCGSIKFAKNGHTKEGIQRFICSDCHKRFNVLTGTIFDSRKISIS